MKKWVNSTGLTQVCNFPEGNSVTIKAGEIVEGDNFQVFASILTEIKGAAKVEKKTETKIEQPKVEATATTQVEAAVTTNVDAEVANPASARRGRPAAATLSPIYSLPPTIAPLLVPYLNFR